MLPVPRYRPETYPPSDRFPRFGSGAGKPPPQFKASEHLHAMMQRKKPANDILRARAAQDFPPAETPYRSVAPSEADLDDMPPLEEVPDEEAPQFNDRPPDRPDDRPQEAPRESAWARARRRVGQGHAVGEPLGIVGAHMLRGVANIGYWGIGGLAGIAGGAIRTVLDPSGDNYVPPDDDEPQPPAREEQPARAQRAVERNGPVAPRVQAIERRAQEVQPQGRQPDYHTIHSSDEEPVMPRPRMRSGRSGGGFGAQAGRAMSSGGPMAWVR